MSEGENRVAEPRNGIFNFDGFQSAVRNTSALEVRIAYRSPRYEHSIKARGDDWIFSCALRKGQLNNGQLSKGANLDPYLIRREFEAIDLDRPEIVARFLDEAGRFWPWETIRLSQVKEWREFFSWLCIDPDEAKKWPEGEKAWSAATALKDSFFTISGLAFTRDRHSVEQWKRFGTSLHFKGKASFDIERLAGLRSFASYPERAGADSPLRLGKYDAGGWLPQHKGVPPEAWEDDQKKSRMGRLESYLRIEAVNILEAIGATIYADRLNGQRFGKCKHCGRIFEIKSDHGQQFCPTPSHLQSSPCKNAFVQHQRRARMRNES